MITPAVLVGGLACILVTGHDARVVGKNNPFTLPRVREIVICGTEDSVEVWYRTKGQVIAVECLAATDGGPLVTVPCDVVP